MYVAVEITAEAVDKSHGAETGVGRGIATTLPDRGLHGAQEYLEQPADNFGLVAQVPPDPFRHREHPLPERDPGQDMVNHVGGRLDHVADRARRTDVPALAGKSDQEVVTAACAIGPGEAVAKEPAVDIDGHGSIYISTNQEVESIYISTKQVGESIYISTFASLFSIVFLKTRFRS